MKKYYVANNDHADEIYGDQEPICIDLAEVERLATEWDMTTEELLDQMHEATPPEIEIYGVYDSSTYTVAQLIKILQQCPQDFPVFIRAEEGYNSNGIYNIYTVGIDQNEKTVDIFVD